LSVWCIFAVKKTDKNIFAYIKNLLLYTGNLQVYSLQTPVLFGKCGFVEW